MCMCAHECVCVCEWNPLGRLSLSLVSDVIYLYYFDSCLKDVLDLLYTSENYANNNHYFLLGT